MKIQVAVYAEAEDLYPKRHLPTDAGWDIRLAEDVWFEPGDRKLVRTGVALKAPDYIDSHGIRLDANGEIWSHDGAFQPTWDIQVRGRGSLWKAGFNWHFGTGDFEYNREYLVGLEWTGKEPISLPRGERIAQFVFAICPYEFELVRSETPFPDRRGGFGSSGRS